LAAAPEQRRVAVFQREFLEDLRHWVRTDRRLALRRGAGPSRGTRAASAERLDAQVAPADGKRA
jgi:hypothetical protein